MSKLGGTFIIIGIVGMLYLIMLLIMPTVNQLVATANASIPAGAEARMPGSQSSLVAMPVIIWWVPALIGMVVEIIYLRH